jgi:hypothetical protein
MPLIFCSSCGNKSEYQFSPPNFCSKCGNPHSSKIGSRKSLSSSKEVARDPLSEKDSDNEDDYENEEEDFFSNSTRVPRINSIKVDIESSSSIRVVKMSDVVNGNLSEEKLKLGNRKDINNILNE